MNEAIGTDFLASVVARFREYKTLGDKTLAQCPDDSLGRVLAPDGNSIAVIVKHVGGNLRSRWRDFLTADGEKPDRNRDGEFEEPGEDVSREQVLAWWEDGWRICLDALASLNAGDLGRSVTIRGQPHAVYDAILRSLAHTSYHIGQMVTITRAFRGNGWTSLSIPRGASVAFNQAMQSTAQSTAQSTTPRS